MPIISVTIVKRGAVFDEVVAKIWKYCAISGENYHFDDYSRSLIWPKDHFVIFTRIALFLTILARSSSSMMIV